MVDADSLVNALLGAVVTIVLSFVPLSPVLGGLLAGYLEGKTREDGVRVGAVSGVIALVPMVAVLLLLGSFGLLLIGLAVPWRLGAVGVVLLLIGLAVAAAYTVGLSALGGWLGSYLRAETDTTA